MYDGEGEYYWIVFCKNHRHHAKQNRSAEHPIFLGETDGVSPPPHLNGEFKVRCEDCRKEYSYNPRDLLRYETEPQEAFLAHPLFTEF